MFQIGKIVNEMDNYLFNIVGVAMLSWTGFDELRTLDNYHITLLVNCFITKELYLHFPLHPLFLYVLL